MTMPVSDCDKDNTISPEGALEAMLKSNKPLNTDLFPGGVFEAYHASILFYVDCGIHFSIIWDHSGNLGKDRADQLAKEATCQDMNILMFVPLSHWKHLAWEKTVFS
ncbi:hypothetical protein TNCV_668731 [Trichonephila clavipes]|nr:hypothetical protein TNCV_668731 [Trichonephila clavipes]